MAVAWDIVLAHDTVYAHVLKEFRWVFVLSQVSKGFADTIRPLRTQIIRYMCANDPGPLLWPSKAVALFGSTSTTMMRRDHILTRTFENINAGFSRRPPPLGLRAHIDAYYAFIRELREQAEVDRSAMQRFDTMQRRKPRIIHRYTPHWQARKDHREKQAIDAYERLQRLRDDCAAREQAKRIALAHGATTAFLSIYDR
jgi:hypothetical protein